MADTTSIKVDVSVLTFDDWDIIIDMQDGKFSHAAVDLIRRCVVGGTEHLAFADMPKIAKLIGEALAALANPTETATGKV